MKCSYIIIVTFKLYIIYEFNTVKINSHKCVSIKLKNEMFINTRYKIYSKFDLFVF